MSKILALALFVLALTSIVSANEKSECLITLYGPAPEPECETITENGQEEVACAAVGAAPLRLRLDSGNRSYKESTELADLDFEGTCECSLRVFTKENFEGFSYSYPFNKSKNGQIIAEIWNQPSKSFKIYCKF